MRFRITIIVILLLLGGSATAGVLGLRSFWKEKNRPRFREAEVVSGDIVSVVNSTGTVQPVLRVQIGTFVSGPIVELRVDFNDHVKKGDLLARIDPRIYKAFVARDEANLATANAEVARATALRQQAINDERRAEELRALNQDYLADSVMDQYKFQRLSLEAQLEVAHAAVKQATATLENSKANLDYTNITSPVDGIVIDRKIDEGQTLAAQFTTPELFVVAPNMEKEMYVYASVDEADIGQIQDAKRRSEPVEFTVDAYPEDLFVGTIDQIRMNPTTMQNVVTYPVVVKCANPELKLMPGMTASLSFQVGRHDKVIRIPNAALRFYPRPEHVRPEDQTLLEGTATDSESAEERNTVAERRSASEKAEAGKKRSRRHVWVVEDNLLKAVEVTTGLSDNKFTEAVGDGLKEGQKLVTGLENP
jgi:HlyD family secretion protein